MRSAKDRGLVDFLDYRYSDRSSQKRQRNGFKWQPRGKRRIHQRPNREEVPACRLWLDEEIDIVRPGWSWRLARRRRRPCSGRLHPSLIMREPDSAARSAGSAEFVKDLKTFARKLNKVR